MKLFTADIDKKLFEQYSEGNDLENQVVVAKIFNPYGRGTWYLLNSDPDDPDYLWAIVDLFEVELGSVSRSELESIKVPPFNQHLERDLGFKPVNALELFNYLIENKKRNRMMAEGGKVYTHDIDIISKSSNDPYFMFPKPTTGKSMGIELKTGGNIDFNIQVGDSVWVDNPHWKASTGNENPVRRVVKMIIGDSIFFSDGSNSSIQYIKKYKKEKKMVDGGIITKSDVSKMQKINIRGFEAYMPNVKTIYFNQNTGKFFYPIDDNEFFELKNEYTLEKLNSFLREKNIILNKTMAEGGYLNEIDIPVIRTQFEEEDYEFEKGGEITDQERKESLKNYPKLKF
jgi:hypothetical protein